MSQTIDFSEIDLTGGLRFNGEAIGAAFHNGERLWPFGVDLLYAGGIGGASYLPDPADVFTGDGSSGFGNSIYGILDRTNGKTEFGPSSSVTGWSGGWSEFSSDGGSFTGSKITAGGTDMTWSTNLFPVVAGRFYEIIVEVVSNTLAGPFSVAMSNTSNGRSSAASISGVGIKRGIVRADFTGSFSINVSATFLGSLSVSSVSIRSVPASARPILQLSASPRPLFGRAPKRGKVNILAASNPATAPQNISGTAPPAGVRSATVVESPGGPFGRTQKKLTINAGASVDVNSHAGFSLQTPAVASPHTLTFVAKPAELDGIFVRIGNYSTSQYNASIRLSDGVVYSSGGGTSWGVLVLKSVEALVNGFSRYEYTFTLGISSSLVIRGLSVGGSASANDGVNGVYLDMVQLEPGESSTAYQEVTTVDVIEEGVPSYPFVRFDLADDVLTTTAASQKNLVRTSEEFNLWAGINVSAVALASGFKLNEAASTAEHGIFISAGVAVTAGQPYTFFFDVAAAERTECYLSFAAAGGRVGAFFNLASVTTTADAGVSANIVEIDDGIYRCSITLTVAVTGTRFPAIFTAENNLRVVTGTGSSGILLYRAQVEIGSAATAYDYGGLFGDIIIAGRNGSAITSGVKAPDGNVSLGPTSYTGGTPGILRAIGDVVGWSILNKTLTAAERERLMRFYKRRGAKGLLVPGGPELVVNGDFSNGTAGWEALNGTISEASGRLRVSYGSANPYARQGVPCVVGKSYLLTGQYFGGTETTRLYMGSANTGANPQGIVDFVGNGSATLVFVATVATMWIIATGRSLIADEFVEFDNISIREIRPEEDW
jgi:hypothetical protein